MFVATEWGFEVAHHVPSLVCVNILAPTVARTVVVPVQIPRGLAEFTLVPLLEQPDNPVQAVVLSLTAHYLPCEEDRLDDEIVCGTTVTGVRVVLVLCPRGTHFTKPILLLYKVNSLASFF